MHGGIGDNQCTSVHCVIGLFNVRFWGRLESLASSLLQQENILTKTIFLTLS